MPDFGIPMILLTIVVVILFGSLFYVLFRYTKLQAEMPLLVQRSIEQWKENELQVVQRQLAESSETRAMVRVNDLAQEKWNVWRISEMDKIKEECRVLAEQGAQNQLIRWKATHETSIRQDAIDRSKATIVGRITEHIVPFLPEFCYNPKDARFVGSPVDFVIFDGLDEEELRRVVFVEVKTGSSALTKRERLIRDAIRSGRVEWSELRVPSKRDLVSNEELPIQT